MTELKNMPPSTPSAAATRPPPDSTDAQKDSAIEAIRKARALNPGAVGYDENATEQKVALMVNNGDFGGYRAIGRFFPNGANPDVSVTEAELKELKAEPQTLIRVVSAQELADLGKGGPSASSAPTLTDEEQKVLAAFRSSGQDSTAFLAQGPTTGIGTSVSGSTLGASSAGSSDTSKRSK